MQCVGDCDLSDSHKCEAKNNPCHEMAQCSQKGGSVACSCFEGYIGDGFDCKMNCSPKGGLSDEHYKIIQNPMNFESARKVTTDVF